MTDIYQRHDKAFQNVTAAAVLHKGEHVANVTLKHGAAVTAYVHWIGLEMTSGRATGGGYDRATAAVAAAVRPAVRNCQKSNAPLPEGYGDFLNALELDGSHRWQAALEHAGFTVCNVLS